MEVRLSCLLRTVQPPLQLQLLHRSLPAPHQRLLPLNMLHLRYAQQDTVHLELLSALCWRCCLFLRGIKSCLVLQKRSPSAMAPSSDYSQPPIKRQRIAHHSAPKTDPKTDPHAPKVTASKQPKTSSVSNSNGGGGLAFSKEKLKLDSPNSLGESQENNNYLGDASPDKDAPDFVR